MQTLTPWHSPWFLHTPCWIAILILTGCFLPVTNAESPTRCCPDETIIDLDTYECIGNGEMTTENTTYFPRCNPGEIFINEPRKSIGSNTDLLADWCVGKSKQNPRIETVVACVSKKNLIKVSKKPTISKCCGMFYRRAGGKCTPSTSKSTKFENEHVIIKDVNIESIQCSSLDVLNIEDYGALTLLPNGSLWVSLPALLLEPGKFCFENSNKTYACLDQHVVPQEPEDQSWVNLLITIGLIISVVFLVATFLIYACEIKNQNLYAKTLMCHIGSITLGFSCLATLQIGSRTIVNSHLLCNDLIPYLMMIAFHSAFFWLNVMAIDIWRTFRCIRSVESVRRNRKMLRFTMYSIYAWGSSIILTLLTLVAEKLPLLPRVITPVIESCWLSRSDYGYHLFFIAPIACVISSNIIMYVMTAYKCHQVKTEINKMHYADKINKNKFSKNKEQLIVNIKLFIVMGLTWSLEVISYLAKRQGQSQSLRYIWYLPDTMNSLYGLILFIIFALKKKNIRRVTRQVSTWMNKRRTESEDLRKISSSINPSSVNNTLIDTTVLEASH